MTLDEISVVSVSNNEDVLRTCLNQSPLITESEKVEFLVFEGYSSASKAYNDAIDKANNDIIVFAHQDVYLPEKWDSLLCQAIRQVNKMDPKWAVLGLVGVDKKNMIQGHSWSNGLNAEVGRHLSKPLATVSIDEIVIILRKSSCVRFDSGLPGFHLYGTDIIQNALHHGCSAYVIDAPVIHNSLPIVTFKSDFYAAYRYMQKKWTKNLPIKTPVTTITKLGWPLIKMQVRSMSQRDNRSTFARLSNPRLKARELGYE